MTQRYLLDTNVISHIMQGRDAKLLARLSKLAVGQAAISNDAESMFQRVLAFDQAVSTARRYAGEKALIIVTGRETLGGLQLNGYPFLGDKGVAILAINNQGYPSLSWSTGPGFDPVNPQRQLPGPRDVREAHSPLQTVRYGSRSS